MPTDSSDDEVRPITGREFDEALDRAEALLRQADDSRKSLARYHVGMVAAWCASAVVVGVVLAAASVGPLGGVIAALVAVLANAALTHQIQSTVVVALKSAVRRDERCAAETVGLLREVLSFVARDEEWTLFKTAEVKLRIGRFPIRGGRI